MIMGDTNQRSAEVQVPSSTTFGDGVFRICSRFSYRAKIEVSKIKKALNQASDPTQLRKEMNLDLAEKGAAREEEHNADVLSRLSTLHHANHPNADEPAPDVEVQSIKYGDTVQLQHVGSALFVAMHKTPARLNPTCRRVSLKAGSFAAHFKLLPRFKVRSMGSTVFAGDDVVLQSVKQEGFFLGAATPQDGSEGFGTPQISLAHLEKGHFGGEDPLLRSIPGLRPPQGLRPQAGLEVNGSIEVRSLTLQLYGRPVAGTLSTGLHFFRLLHPETDSFMQASSDPDKGEVLDSIPGEDGDSAHKEQTRFLRVGGLPAHVPYLKLLPHGADPSSKSHLNGKACWVFESMDRTECSPVRWYSMPLRLRHVASGKYLAVDTSSPTKQSSSVNLPPPRGADINVVNFDTMLVKESVEGMTHPSTVFFVLPIDGDSYGNNLSGDISSIRLEHRSLPGKTLHFSVLREPKPPLLRSKSSNRESIDAGSDAETARLSHHRLRSTRRIVFSTERSELDILKVCPVSHSFVTRLKKLMSYIPELKRYSQVYHASAFDEVCDKTGPVAVLQLCDSLAGHCLDLIKAFRRGAESFSHDRDQIAKEHFMAIMMETSYMAPAALAQLFGGDRDVKMQKLAHELKLLDALFNAIIAPYNWRSKSQWKTDARLTRHPFDSSPMDGKPLAIHRLLHIAVQKALQGNIGAQTYFSHRKSRVWSKVGWK
jgi:hypothetical protein